MKLKTILLFNVSRGAIIRHVIQYQQTRKDDYLKFIKGQENNSFKVIKGDPINIDVDHLITTGECILETNNTIQTDLKQFEITSCKIK